MTELRSWSSASSPTPPLACSQIDVDNAPSIRLHRSVGMLVGTGITAWLAEPDAAWAP